MVRAQTSLRSLLFSSAGTMFVQQHKPRGGVVKILSDGEKLFVTENNRRQIGKKIEGVTFLVTPLFFI